MTSENHTPQLPTKPEVERERRLDRLGEEIDALRENLRKTIVEQTVEIGERLIMAKRIARHGQWLPWLRKRQMSERSAQNYMKMASYITELRGTNPKRVSDFVNMSYREALKAIQEPRDPSPSTSPRLRGADTALPSAEAFEPQPEAEAADDMATGSIFNTSWDEAVAATAVAARSPEPQAIPPHRINRCMATIRRLFLEAMDDLEPEQWPVLLAELRGQLTDLTEIAAKRQRDGPAGAPGFVAVPASPRAKQEALPDDPDAELRRRLKDHIAAHRPTAGNRSGARELTISDCEDLHASGKRLLPGRLGHRPDSGPLLRKLYHSQGSWNGTATPIQRWTT